MLSEAKHLAFVSSTEILRCYAQDDIKRQIGFLRWVL